MNLDHGLLNLPLAKRGDINAQLDRHNREKTALAASAAKSRAAERRELKAQARAALADLDCCPGLLEAKAAKLGVTRAKVYASLLDWAKWEPARVIKARAEWMGEQ